MRSVGTGTVASSLSPAIHASPSTQSMDSYLRALSLDDLASLHMLLTRYIVAQQRGRFREAEHVANTIANRFGIEVGDALRADVLRRKVHEILREKAREEAEKGDSKIVIKEPFALPDVEVAVLALADDIEFGKIVVTRNRIGIKSEEVEHYRVYGEPVGRGLYVGIECRQFFDGSRRLEIHGELYGILGEDIDYTYAFRALSPKKVKELIEKGEVDVEDICREEEEAGVVGKPTCTTLQDIASGKVDELEDTIILKYDACLPIAYMCIPLKSGGYLNFVVRHPYNEAVLWRELGDEALRFPIVEELRKLGLDADVDRIYHEYPAEYDVGAESRAIVHISFSKYIDIDTPEDEVRAAQEVAKILKGIARIYFGKE